MALVLLSKDRFPIFDTRDKLKSLNSRRVKKLDSTSDKGATIRILGGLEFLEINLLWGKMGEINKWPQGGWWKYSLS